MDLRLLQMPISCVDKHGAGGEATLITDLLYPKFHPKNGGTYAPSPIFPGGYCRRLRR